MWQSLLMFLRFNSHKLVYSAWLVFLFTCGAVAFRVGLNAGIYYGKKWLKTRNMWPAWIGDSINSASASESTQMNWVTKGLPMFVVACSFLAVGWMAKDIQQLNHLRRQRAYITGDWTVDRSLEPHTYSISNGKIRICNDGSPDPGFDVGDCVDLVYEEKSDGRGICHSFADPHSTFFSLCGEETWDRTTRLLLPDASQVTPAGIAKRGR